MSPNRPNTPRPSGSGASRSTRSGGRNTRPASGQVPAAGKPSRPANSGTPRPNPSGSASTRTTQPRQASTPAQGQRNAPRSSTASGSANPRTPAPNSRPKATTGKAASAGTGASSQRNTKPRTSQPRTANENVATYAVHGNSKGVGFLQNTTVRVVALVSCVIIAIVILAPVARSYIKQYNANADLKAQIAAQQAQNEELRNDLSRWDDNNYVIAQARERLTFVFPGETPYRVMGWDSKDLEEITPENVAPAMFPDQQMPWYEELLGSVQKSGSLGDRESVSGTVPDDLNDGADIEKPADKDSESEPESD